MRPDFSLNNNNFQRTNFISIVGGVGKRGTYRLVHGDLPRQHAFGTTLKLPALCQRTLGSEDHRYAIA